MAQMRTSLEPWSFGLRLTSSECRMDGSALQESELGQAHVGGIDFRNLWEVVLGQWQRFPILSAVQEIQNALTRPV